MRNASGHNYRNSSFIVDVAMGQIPRSTEHISSSRNNLDSVLFQPMNLLKNALFKFSAFCREEVLYEVVPHKRYQYC